MWEMPGEKITHLYNIFKCVLNATQLHVTKVLRQMIVVYSN